MSKYEKEKENQMTQDERKAANSFVGNLQKQVVAVAALIMLVLFVGAYLGIPYNYMTANFLKETVFQIFKKQSKQPGLTFLFLFIYV